MADISDVQNALVALAAQVIYPSGTSQPSVVGVGVRIYPGWPVPAQLDQDLAAGACHVSVFARDDERNTTRFTRRWVQVHQPVHTFTLTVAGSAVTVGGIPPSVGGIQNLAIIANERTLIYQAGHGDTPTTCATALAALALAAGIAGTSSAGAVVTFPAGTLVSAARVGGVAGMAQEVRRQERILQMAIWADTPAHRDALAAPLDAALADTPYLAMPDGFAARLRYRSSPVTDDYQAERLYRRDLWYSVEYATTQADESYEVVSIEQNMM